MKELFKVTRLAFYICALPLVATASVSAFQFLENNGDDDVNALGVSVKTESLVLQDKQMTYVVRRSAEGVVTGRVVEIDPDTSKVKGISGLSIQFAQNGNLVAKTTTDNTGSFSVGDMATGFYSFFGINKEAFVSFATQIVDDNEENAAYSLFVEAGATTGMVQQLTANLNSSKKLNLLSQLTPENRPEFKNLKGGMRVQLSDNGTLKGRSVSLFKEGNDLLEGTVIQIYQKGKLIGETKTDTKGNYTFENIDDGVYDLVAVGRGGFAAFRFDAVRAVQDVTKKDDGTIPTSRNAAQEIETSMAPVQEFALSPFNDAVFVQDTVTPQDQDPIPDSGQLPPGDGGPAAFVPDGFGGGTPTGAGGGGFWRAGWIIPIIVTGGSSSPAPVSPIN